MNAVGNILAAIAIGGAGFVMGTTTSSEKTVHEPGRVVVEVKRSCLDALDTAEAGFAINRRIVQTWVDEQRGKPIDEVLVEVTQENDDLKPIVKAFTKQKGDCRD